MKSSQPTAAQKRWRKSVRSLGSIISGGPAVIHHAVGRTATHCKIPIGHEWIIPLTDEEHKALHNGETFGYESRKAFEKWGFRQAYFYATLHNGFEDAPTDEQVGAIAEYHK